MNNSQPPDNLSITELEQLLYRKKHAARRERWQWLKDEGRMVEVAGRPVLGVPAAASVASQSGPYRGDAPLPAGIGRRSRCSPRKCDG